MAVFLLSMKNAQISQADFDGLRDLLHSKFGEPNVYTASPAQIFLLSPDIFMPQQLAEFIGSEFSEGKYGSYILVPVNAYWGYHDSSLWNWLAGKI